MTLVCAENAYADETVDAVDATLLLANLIATAPAWAAGRTRPALVLRAE